MACPGPGAGGSQGGELHGLPEEQVGHHTGETALEIVQSFIESMRALLRLQFVYRVILLNRSLCKRTLYLVILNS